MMPLGAPSISKYGSLVRPDAQIATAIERGGRIRIGSLVGKDGARWLYNPCRLGDPHRLRAGGRIRKGPTSGQGGYITPLGAFGARWLLGPIPLTTNCRPEAPGGGGGSWRPRTRGVAPPPTSPPLPPPPYLPPLPPPTCTLRTPPARPSTPPCGTPSEATGHRPARTHRPALASGTRARGRRYPRARPRPQPPSNASCQPQVPRPAGGPRQARRHPCACAPRSLAYTARSPPARPSTPLCGALGASADRRLDRPHLPATATGPAPAWRRLRLGCPPLPMHPAPASAPRQRNLLTAGPSARRGAPTGHADALAHAPPAARPAGRALPRHAHRPHCVGRSGPLPTAGWTARTPPRPPRAPHPHGAASASAARRYPCARPGPRPPAGCAARPPVSRTQGQAPGDST